MNLKITALFTNAAKILLVVLSFAGLNLQAATLNPDYQYTRISGSSMLPTLKHGEMTVVYKAYPYEKLRAGDIVIIESERGFSVIHRVERRYRGQLWVTKGDNNKKEDYEVLSPKNFGGLALVGASTLKRYESHLASMNQNPVDVNVAMAYNGK